MPKPKPQQPPRDDPTISDEDFLYRRIFPDADALRPTNDGWRPKSGSLKSNVSLSVDLASETTAEQTRDRDTSVPFHVARIPVRVVRSAGCGVVRDPRPDNPAHALICGTGGGEALTGSEAKRIARQSEIVLVNPGAEVPGD